MKIHFNKNLAKKVTKRFFLMIAANLFVAIFVVAAGWMFLGYYLENNNTCKKEEMINALDSLYRLKAEIIKEREKIVAQAMYFDTLAALDPTGNLGIKNYIADKTTRDLKIGDINTSIQEIDDHVINVKKCDYSSGQIDQRIKSIRYNIFGNNSDQSTAL